MPKLPIFSGKDVCRVLNKHGFMEIRRRGSHVIMQKRTGDTTITVPVPDHKELRLGTLQAIVRQSGLSKAIFEHI